MSNTVIQIMGKNIVVVPDTPGEGNCLRCAFGLDCLTTEEEESAGVTSCIVGKHHYEEVSDAD